MKIMSFFHQNSQCMTSNRKPDIKQNKHEMNNTLYESALARTEIEEEEIEAEVA